MTGVLQRFGLDFNPFEPTGAGVPLTGLEALSFPPDMEQETKRLLDELGVGRGERTIIVVGEYGTGKTCLLQNLHQRIFPARRVKPFYFDNPGVHFYNLANMLLRTIGRKDFAKFVWELASPHVRGMQQSLFAKGMEAYLLQAKTRQGMIDVTNALQTAVQSAGIVDDDEIAHCLARIVTNTVRKPYFEYRDFIPRQSGNVVAEGEEAPYFRALLNTIAKGENAEAVAFLIDEFEEIGLQKRLTSRAAHDYLATLKRLVNLSANVEKPHFWLVLSMTHDAYEATQNLEPALFNRIAGSSHVLEVQPLKPQEAARLVKSRLALARGAQARGLFPFPDKLPFRNSTQGNARRLVKTCFFAISKANARTRVPFSNEFLRKVEENVFPSPS